MHVKIPRIGAYVMKHKKRKLLAVVTAVFMALTVCMIPADSVSAESNTDVKWTDGITGGAIYFDKSTGAITSCDSTVTAAVIPAVIDDTEVTTIGKEAFYDCDALTSVEIQEGVATIEEDAFRDCDALSDLKIPDTVTFIGGMAFYSCDLTNVEIPKGVTSIEDEAFGCCSKLTDITVAEGNDSFSSEGGVLYNKAKTELIQYPINNARTSFTVPDTVKTICYSAFYTCSNLTSIALPNGLTVIAGRAFWGCKNLSGITIPNGVTSIGDEAFASCKKIAEIEIPGSVAVISGNTFNSCKTLANITVAKNNATYSASDGVLYDKNQTVLIKCPAANDRTSYAIPSSVKTIGEYAFYGCSSLTDVTIPSNVTAIENYAFFGCSSLTDITIPNKVTSIGKQAFSCCESLTDIIIPDSVKTIGDYAFLSSDSITSIVIPDSVTSIGKDAFPYTTLYGYKGSYADGYAAHRYPFEEIISDAPVKVSANLDKYHDTLKVSWSKVEGADGYYVYYKKSTWSSYQKLGTTTVLSYSKAKLADGAKYKFAVYPYMNIGDQKYMTKNSKASDYVYTLKKLNKPGVKKSSRSYVRVSWNNIPGETGYQIARSKSSNKNYKIVKRVSNKYKSTKIKTPRYKKYYYKVRAYKTVNGKRIYGPWSSGKSYRLI